MARISNDQQWSPCLLFVRREKGTDLIFWITVFGNGGGMARAAPAVLANDVPHKMQKQKWLSLLLFLML